MNTTAMKEVTRYQCEFCKKDFKTPNRHYCKKNPELKNCFTCKHLKGWEESEDNGEYGYEYYKEPNCPDCAADMDGWDIETIKEVKYDMQCDKWEQGKYDWREDFLCLIPF